MTSSDLHIELYKKYRPNTWRGLIGQQTVARSLQSAIKANKVPTAYLFSGERGTGKTSSALLLAKAINCLNPVEETADPCNKCEVCTSIDNGTQPGVTYVSAAQRSGVEDIKDLIAKARLSMPIKRQVFIIDEIHNLKQGKGFEALLIPLEEVGMPALFIFCTTEIEKVPQTIVSRVQSRRLNLVDSETMLKYVTAIAKREALDLPENLLQEAVRQGRGSVRDTLTALETVSSTGEFVQPLGGKLLEALASHDMTGVLTVIAEANANGEGMSEMSEALFEDLRDLLLVAGGVTGDLVGTLPVEDPKAIVKALLGARGIMIMMDELGTAITQTSMGADARISLEVAMVKSFNNLRRLKKQLESRS